jgi:hypothetical protein
MIKYAANPCRAALPAMAAGQLVVIATPKQHNRIPDGALWVADNGCGPGKHGIGKGYPGDERFLAWLASHEAERCRCLFAAAPDVVGSAQATLARSLPMLPRIRELGYPAALVAQDGLELSEVPWAAFDALFIGGSTEWKLGPDAARLVRAAKARGKHVHFGRVNSRKRLRYAAELGCDTADGTYLTFGPDRNLPILLGWLRELAQPELELS